MSKFYDFDIRYDRFETECCPKISEFPKLTVSQLIGENKQVCNLHTIEILFDYPLSNPVTLQFHNPNGFRLWDIYESVYDGYCKIYGEEQDPGYIDGMLNRKTSSGQYGIWGHYMDDLFLEGFEQTEPGKFILHIGS